MLEDRGRRVLPRDADQVESQTKSASRLGMGHYPRARQAPQPIASPEIDRREGVAEPLGPARLDLDHDEVAPAGRDDVELALAVTPVAVDDPIAAVLEVGGGPLLPRATPVVFRCHDARLAKRHTPEPVRTQTVESAGGADAGEESAVE